MSEADSANRDSGLTESIASGDPIAPVESPISVPDTTNDEGWQTVDFPGAMNVDAIPPATTPVPPDPAVLSALASLNEVSAAVSAASAPLSAVAAINSQQLQQLQQENQTLRDRLTQLERDMAQQQVEFQLEMARMLHSAPIAAPSLSNGETNHVETSQSEPELMAAQEHISQLFQELEFAQQTAQRQQILVETLTKQLESSQERIAQLERDCALGQQRYNDQVQQILQVENTCRDLRMRLHRQQQQTLQFKAALEKCLEVPVAYNPSHLIVNPEQNASAGMPTVPTTATAASQGLAPKSQPVRPWTVPAIQAMEGIAHNQLLHLPKPLSQLINPEATPDATPIADDATNSPGDADLDQIFAASEGNPTAPTMGNQAAAIFDVSPFLQDESSSGTLPQPDQSAISAVPLQSDDGLLKMLASVPLDADVLGQSLESFWGSDREDGLWNDLAKLIDPAPSTESDANLAPTAAALATELDAHREPANPDDRAQSPVPTDSPSANPAISTLAITGQESATKKPLELTSWAARSNRGTGRSRLQPIKPQSTEGTGDTAAVTTATVTDSTPPAKPADRSASKDLLTPGWPSPIVYPLRSTKKLNSLAAVELPTFPKAR